MSPSHQDLSNDTTFSQIKSRVPVPLKTQINYLKKKKLVYSGAFWQFIKKRKGLNEKKDINS